MQIVEATYSVNRNSLKITKMDDLVTVVLLGPESKALHSTVIDGRSTDSMIRAAAVAKIIYEDSYGHKGTNGDLVPIAAAIHQFLN